MLVLCADGITESIDEEQEEYGVGCLVNCVRNAVTRSVAEIVNAVNAHVAVFSRKRTHLDDKAMIATKVT